ncbi:MAG TPA: thermosome subunit, partial [Candidatus Poseidoniales archaeon]
LRKAQAEGKATFGVNVFEGGVMDMQVAQVLEPTRVVEQAIQSATETAVMILRIDDVISSKAVSGGGMDGMDFDM